MRAVKVQKPRWVLELEDDELAVLVHLVRNSDRYTSESNLHMKMYEQFNRAEWERLDNRGGVLAIDLQQAVTA